MIIDVAHGLAQRKEDTKTWVKVMQRKLGFSPCSSIYSHDADISILTRDDDLVSNSKYVCTYIMNWCMVMW